MQQLSSARASMSHGVSVLALLLLSASATAQVPGEPYEVRAAVSSCLKLRPQPDADTDPVACLAAGTRVTATDAVPFWRMVTAPDGTTGWVSKRYIGPVPAATLLSAESARAAIPSDAPPPPEAAVESHWLEIHVVDVGQGDGIWITTPDDGIAGNGRYEGKNIVIDGGPDQNDARNEMLRYLLAHAHDGAMIDALIVTHPHDDHYPGAIGVLGHFEVREYYDPGFPKTGTKYNDFLATVRRERAEGRRIGINRGPLGRLGTLNWGRELKAEFLHSYPGQPDDLGSGSTLENNASLVLRLEYGEHVFLFMGDAEGKDRNDGPEDAHYVERMLLDNSAPGRLKATVLKLAHHGSETSSTLPFIEAVDPDVIIASSGRRAYSGTYLPDASTLARYCAHKSSTRIYRTDHGDERQRRTTTDDADGDHIVIRTDGRTLQITAYDNGQALPSSAARCSP